MASPPKSGRPDGTVLPQYPIESVDNALRLLLLFADRPRVRLTEVSRHLGVASSTAHRLLAMLQYRGFVRQEVGSRAYTAGPALTSVAFCVLDRLTPAQRARPVLEQLCAELDAPTDLGRLEGAWVRVLETAGSGGPGPGRSGAGTVLPADGCAAGRAMLSRMSQAQLHVLYPRPSAVEANVAPGADPGLLDRDLAVCRERGFALGEAEGEKGFTAVAVPVPSPVGVFYAVSACVPTSRLAAEPGRVVESLRRGAEDLSRLLLSP